MIISSHESLPMAMALGRRARQKAAMAVFNNSRTVMDAEKVAEIIATAIINAAEAIATAENSTESGDLTKKP